MISKSFRLFFLDPLKDLSQGCHSYINFTFGFILDAILLRNINDKTPDDLLLETFKILKIIIFLLSQILHLMRYSERLIRIFGMR